jgi:hypothetical protein
MLPICRNTFASTLIVVAVAGLLQATPVRAQSTTASQLSAISVAPSAASAEVALAALPAGSELVVTALRTVGDVVVLSVEAAGHGAAISLEVSAAAVRSTGLVVGSVLVTAATSAGVMISVGSEVVAFVPDALARSLIHHQEL